MAFADRLLTIVVTATLTSAAWIVAGTFMVVRPPASSVPAAERAAAGPAGPVGAAAHPTEAVAQAAPGDARGLIIPVAGVTADQLSDTFNDARNGHRHGALDIMAARGSEVVAAAPGTVEKLFHSDAGGNTIYVRSPDRTTIYYYAHLDRYADGLKEGQPVERGEVIGAVGSSGDASAAAPHLHFEIMRTTPEAKWYQPAMDVDPYPLLTGKPTR